MKDATQVAFHSNGSPRVVVLGGSGFVGRRFAEMMVDSGSKLTYVIHRTRPKWLERMPIDLALHALDDLNSLRLSLLGADVVVNLLRPDGQGWLISLMQQIVPIIKGSEINRLVHVSSIDVYGNAPERYITETTQPLPLSPYAQEHLACELLVSALGARAIVLRSGAVFGPGGRNVVSFADEAATASNWRLAARHVLYGPCRMHLVSVESLCAVLIFLASNLSREAPRYVLATDDDDEQNNFAFLQQTLAEAFGRRSFASFPKTPSLVLEAVFRLRGRPPEIVRRRFSSERVLTLGINRPNFVERLQTYAAYLAAARVPD